MSQQLPQFETFCYYYTYCRCESPRYRESRRVSGTYHPIRKHIVWSYSQIKIPARSLRIIDIKIARRDRGWTEPVYCYGSNKNARILTDFTSESPIHLLFCIGKINLIDRYLAYGIALPSTIASCYLQYATYCLPAATWCLHEKS